MLNILSSRQIVECFHLLFLGQLTQKLDKKLFSLKGGCNLRFFMKSIRYSEDIDLDIAVIAKDTLTKKIRGILTSTPFNMVLRPRGIVDLEISEPKQTETTQRWKIGLKCANQSFLLRTKIEFSRRGLDSGTRFEAIDPVLSRTYGLAPTLLTHYRLEMAFAQKIRALSGRKETQARDVFDLNLLLDAGVKPAKRGGVAADNAESARERLLNLGFDHFKGQVLAYLHEDYQKQYDSKELWDSMVLRVCDALSSGKS